MGVVKCPGLCFLPVMFVLQGSSLPVMFLLQGVVLLGGCMLCIASRAPAQSASREGGPRRVVARLKAAMETMDGCFFERQLVQA
eukprot:gene40576-36821_t